MAFLLFLEQNEPLPILKMCTCSSHGLWNISWLASPHHLELMLNYIFRKHLRQCLSTLFNAVPNLFSFSCSEIILCICFYFFSLNSEGENFIRLVYSCIPQLLQKAWHMKTINICWVNKLMTIHKGRNELNISPSKLCRLKSVSRNVKFMKI